MGPGASLPGLLLSVRGDHGKQDVPRCKFRRHPWRVEPGPILWRLILWNREPGKSAPCSIDAFDKVALPFKISGYHVASSIASRVSRTRSPPAWRRQPVVPKPEPGTTFQGHPWGHGTCATRPTRSGCPSREHRFPDRRLAPCARVPAEPGIPDASSLE